MFLVYNYQTRKDGGTLLQKYILVKFISERKYFMIFFAENLFF